MRPWWAPAVVRLCGSCERAGLEACKMNGWAERTAWQPGQPVVTEQDHAEGRAGRGVRVREGRRRSRMGRIDYYPSEETAAVIDSPRPRRTGRDASSIVNRIVAE